MLRLVAREARRQVLVARLRAVQTEEPGQGRTIERVVDGSPKPRVVLEERTLRVQRQERDDRLLHHEEVGLVALEFLRQLGERRRRDDAVVRLPTLELQPDLRGERAEAVDDLTHIGFARPVVVRVPAEQQRPAGRVARDCERAGRRKIVALLVRRRARDRTEVRQRQALDEVRRGRAQVDRQRLARRRATREPHADRCRPVRRARASAPARTSARTMRR